MVEKKPTSQDEIDTNGQHEMRTFDQIVATAKETKSGMVIPYGSTGIVFGSIPEHLRPTPERTLLVDMVGNTAHQKVYDIPNVSPANLQIK